MANRAFFRRYLGARRSQFERFAGSTIRNCPRPSGRRAVVVAGAMVGSVCHLRRSPTSRESGQHVLHAPDHRWRRTRCGAEFVSRSRCSADAENPKIDLPHDDASEQECDRRLKAQGTSDFALLNPGAGWGAKQWPAERYGEVATRLAENGLRSLINVGPGEEDLGRAVESESGGRAEIFTGSLTQLIALTGRERVFIGSDTGPMHLAVALGVPVVIFGPTDPARNGPLGSGSIVLRSSASNTSYRHVPGRMTACLRSALAGGCRRTTTAGRASWLAGLLLRAGSGCRWASLLPCSIFGWPNCEIYSDRHSLVIPGLLIRALASGQLQKNGRLATGGRYAHAEPAVPRLLILAIGFALPSRKGGLSPGSFFFLCDLCSCDSCRGNISMPALFPQP